MQKRRKVTKIAQNIFRHQNNVVILWRFYRKAIYD